MAHILIIEPDKQLGRTYQACLKREGHQVDWVAHAQDAVHVADEKQPDVVILELQLSRHNGIEFLYEFRSYPEWQNVPVILLTLVPPAALSITAAMMERLGIVGCLYKPATSLAQLRRTIADVLQPQVS